MVITDKDKIRIVGDTIELVDQKVTIAVKAGLFQSVRGFSTAVVLLDELAFARSENSAQPVEELIAALTPSIMENGLLIGASTPFTPFGFLYEQFDEHFGKDDDEILIWHGSTLRMNPTFSKKKIERDIRKDKARYESEYNATFRSDIENLLPKFMIDAAMKRDQTMPEPGRQYECFVDASGGRVDSYCMAIGYVNDDGKAVVARLEERVPPLDPAAVTAEFAEILKSYGVRRIRSDNYAGQWPVSAWTKLGIAAEMADASASRLYAEFVALMSMSRVELIKNERLSVQLQQLERRVRQGGQEEITHPSGGHDDCANVVAGLAVYLLRNRRWTEKEIESKLPTLSHGIPKEYERPEVQPTRIRQSAEAEMRDFMVETGCNEIVRSGMRAPWTPRKEPKVGETVTVASGGKA